MRDGFLSVFPAMRALRRSSGSLFLLAALLGVPTHGQVKREIRPDGVEHWTVREPTDGQSYLTRKFAEMYNVVSPKPFGRSVAFLAGVGKYRYLLPQLPSVHNDLVEMREFLINKAGFDEVYVAEDGIVDRDLIEQYVKGILPAKMQKNDRLLFYYSGHGGDNNGKTGYMLFSNARKGQFYGKDVLGVDSLNDWSQELPFQHILFILDSCASGLGITAKSGNSDSDKLLLQTLSGNGSRTVLTAGTADEATYAEDSRQQTGNSFFTKSFVKAFDSLSLSDQKTGFITISDLFADIEKQMAAFRVSHGKATTPRMWKLQEFDYRGTFVFLNPRATATSLTGEQAKALGVTIVRKGEDSGSPIPTTGIVEVTSVYPGRLYIDGQDMGAMIYPETRQFLGQSAGKHHLRFQGFQDGKEGETKEVTVEDGRISYISFGLTSPIDETGKVPVGVLELESTQELSGEVLIDNFRVGLLPRNGKLTIANLTVGLHNCRIVGTTQTESRSVEIRPNQTDYVRWTPAPITNLTATPQ